MSDYCENLLSKGCSAKIYKHQLDKSRPWHARIYNSEGRQLGSLLFYPTLKAIKEAIPVELENDSATITRNPELDDEFHQSIDDIARVFGYLGTQSIAEHILSDD